ncbi:MAG: alpha/beta hydrolase [Pelagimonas sp.]|jgi:pimeloyl-ACP methyl ester carboxylesterase|nr:alpha/beta hydrolase [Pelagimonas sp.]
MPDPKPQTALFCHGVPGSVLDAQLIPRSDHLMLQSDNLLKIRPDYVPQVLRDAQAPMPVVGFSIGVMVALKLAALYPEQVEKLVLISPAAPLSLGAFLPHMAGAPVFRLAQNAPWALRALTWAQAQMVRIAPNAIVRQLFAKCGPRERALLETPAMQDAVLQALRNSYLENRAGYFSLLQDYVSDWAPVLDQVTCPVEIWHGAKDSWAPLSMSEALKTRLPGKVTLNVVEGGEHYSTLTHVRL